MAFVPVYIFILGFTIVIDYFAGILLEKAEQKKKKIYLMASLAANLGVLSFFKYYNFINENISSFFNFFGHKNHIPYLNIILPVGLSFHTFQAMSYTIEIYRGNQKAERNFLMYSLYVMFYPQLVAGPIERPQNLLHQFYEKHYFDLERVTFGIKQIFWGLFKKIVIADRLSLYVDAVYNHPSHHFGFTVIIATIFFAFQIYCDFSGYSDIAIGAARVMGFELMTNFKTPYFSKSISEFWKRWHISLSTWFKDYVYISLGGNRVKISRLYFNFLFVFLLSGLWHGANWTFIFWGALNGLYLIVEMIAKKYFPSPSYRMYLSLPLTFLLICISWVFFRASNMADAFLILKNSLFFNRPFFSDKSTLIYGLFGILILLVFEFFMNKKNWVIPFQSSPKVTGVALYTCLIMLILAIGVINGGQFIYFQF